MKMRIFFLFLTLLLSLSTSGQLDRGIYKLNFSTLSGRAYEGLLHFNGNSGSLRIKFFYDPCNCQITIEEKVTESVPGNNGDYTLVGTNPQVLAGSLGSQKYNADKFVFYSNQKAKLMDKNGYQGEATFTEITNPLESERLNTAFGWNARVISPTLHVIIVMGTNDKKTGKGAKIAEKRLKKFLARIKNEAGISYKVHNFSGDNFQKEKVEDFLQSFTPNSNDAVLFYFFGHGFWQGDINDSYPTVQIGKYYENLWETSLELSVINNTLKAKQVRLLITIGESCNENIWGGSHASMSEILWSKVNIRRLFYEAQGNAIISSTGPNGTSYSMEDGFGAGYFFDSFLLSLEKEIGKSGFAYWKNIFQHTKKLTEENAGLDGKIQTPIYDSNIQ